MPPCWPLVPPAAHVLRSSLIIAVSRYLPLFFAPRSYPFLFPVLKCCELSYCFMPLLSLHFCLYLFSVVPPCLLVFRVVPCSSSLFPAAAASYWLGKVVVRGDLLLPGRSEWWGAFVAVATFPVKSEAERSRPRFLFMRKSTYTQGHTRTHTHAHALLPHAHGNQHPHTHTHILVYHTSFRHRKY